MRDEAKSREQLLSELAGLRQRVAEFEQLQTRRKVVADQSVFDAEDRYLGRRVSNREITDRKQGEEALQTAHDELERRVEERTVELALANEALLVSQTLFESLARVSPVGIFRTDAQGDYTYVNERWCQMADTRSGKALSGCCFDAVHTEDRQRVTEEWTSCVEKGLPFRSEYRYQRSDGLVTSLLGQALPEANHLGEVIGYVGTITDITEQKQAQEALRESEERFRAVFLTLRDGLLLVDLKTSKFLEGNPAIQEMLGYSDEEIKRLAIPDIHPEQHLRAVIKQFGELVTGKIDIAQEVPVRRRDDSVFYADISTSLPMSVKGRHCLIGVFRDITMRRQTQEALRDAYQELQDIIEFLPDATFVVDREKKVVAWNRAMQEMTGVEEKNILGRGEYSSVFYGEALPIMIDLVMGEESPAEDTRYTVLERKGKTIFGEAFVPMTFKGKSVSVWATATPLYDVRGELIGAIESIRDITNLKRAEDQITKLNSLKQFLLGTSSLEEKLKFITDGAVEIFGADFARIWLIRKGDLCSHSCIYATTAEKSSGCRDSRCLHLVASSGRYTSTDGTYRRVPLGARKVGRIASGYDTDYITNDFNQDPSIDQEWASSLGLVAFAGIRLVSSDLESMGVLAMFRKEPIQPNEEKLVQNLADTTSQVIMTGMAEEALRESEAKFRAMFDHSPMGISIAQQGATLLYNEAGLRIFGYDDNSEVAGMSPLSRIAPHCRDEISEYIKRRERGEAVPGIYETEGIRRDGAIFHLSFQGTGIQWDGQPATVSFFSDVTNRKVAEGELIKYRDHLEELVRERTSELSRANEQLTQLIEEHRITGEDLKERKEFLAAIVENIPDMIFVKDAKDLRFVRFNRAGEDLLGYPREDLIGKGDHDFFPHPEADFFTAKDREVLHGRHLVDIQEETIQTRRQGQRILHTKKIPILDQNGDPQYLLGISQDITEHMQAKAALLRSEESLQHSQQNLRSLTSQLFTIQEKERQRISKELHDGLGQDLTVMKLYLTSIKNKLKRDQKSLQDDCKFLLGRIDHSVADMRRLCHDLSPYLLEELGLAASLKHLFEEVCQRNGLSCLLDMQDIGPNLPQRTLASIYRIFQEILTNIVKHSGATQVSLSIKRQGERVNFSVADDGKGFDVRDVGRRPASRRGMGLIAMEERAHMLGGAFQIVSRIGQGTAVTFSLTLSEREEP